jgi:tetratricopeptide (TPR) repeat protein
MGPYRLDRELGAGGMGKVWAARVEGRVPGLDVGRVVALKVVHPHLLETPGFFKRFLREADIGKAVVHENVVRTFDCDSLSADGKRADFLVMEYVEGQTLRSLLAELERVPEELCRHIGREVAKGLAAIHAAGVVHRDMKPENVIITADHAVKVMDLGVARLQDEAMRLSQTGAFVGSIHYAAPESFREGGKHVDGRADLHALGLVLYELACGVNPYLADDIPQTLRKVLHEEPRRLAELNPQLSSFFEEIVHSLLAKSPDERIASAAELAATLDEGESSPWWKARAKSIREETRRPLRRVRIPRETALFGRDAELAKVRAVYEKAKAGEGQVLLVEGEAGIGKSRLVDEFVGLLQREGEDVDFLFGSYPPGGAATASGAFSTAYREQFGEAGSAGYLKLTPILVPAFDALLRGETTPSGVEPLTKDSLQTCFVNATHALAAERTAIVLIDDLHFAPSEGCALFAALAMAVPGHRVLLVGTTRPGLDEKWLAGIERTGVARMPLRRLGAKDVSRLLIEALRSERTAEELALKVLTKSDGNPFFVFEILRGLRDGQFLTRDGDGTWVSTGALADIRIPSSILELVQARVADLSSEERDLLDVAACLGYEFDPLLVAAAGGVARIPALKRLGQIERAHRLVRSVGDRYVFDHHQVQEALYASISDPLKREYHAAIAEALETQAGAREKDPAGLDGALCVDLAEHFLEGARGAQALRYLSAALKHLEDGWLSDAAVRLAERALAVPGLVAGRARPELLVRMVGRLAVLGRREAEAAALAEAKGLADALGDSALRIRCRSALGWHFIRTSETDKAQPVLEEAFALAREAGDRAGECSAAANLGNLHQVRGRFSEAQRMFERQLVLAREIGNRTSEAGATGNLGIVFDALGRHAEAQAHYERHRVLAEANRDRQGECMATGHLASVTRYRGYFADAHALYERALALAREIGFRRSEAIHLVNLGPLRLALGDAGRAREHLERSLAICRQIGARYPEAYALAGLGSVADEEGDTVTARARFEEALAIRREIGHADGVASSQLVLGNLLRREGDIDGARDALEAVVSSARAQGDQAQLASGLAILALLPGGDARSAEEAFAEAGATLPVEDALRIRARLWQATRDRAHLGEAKKLLDFLVENAPEESRGPMLANVRLHREIVAACKAEGIA